jgi:hypothetical protein
MIKAMKELEKLQPPKATALQQFNTSITDLSQSVGDNLLPALTPLIQGLTAIAEMFGKLPQPIQTTIIGITAFGLAIGALKFAGVLGGIGQMIGLLGKLGGVIAQTKLAATLAGAAGAVVPAVTTALTGLLTWMATTFVPAMVAFFSGPVGWIALGVAALIAGIIIFREPIEKFLSWVFEKIAEFWKGVWDFIYGTQIKPWVDLWNNHLKKPITDFSNDIIKGLQNTWKAIVDFANTDFSKKWNDVWTGLQKAPENVKNSVTRWFTDAANTISRYWGLVAGEIQQTWDNVTRFMGNGWRLMMSGVRKVLNDIIGIWNLVADKTQGLPGFARIPRINPIPEPPPVPGFADGGYIDRPTLGLIGENPRNPREYIIPEGGMDRAVAGWRAGLRGDALVQAWQSPGLSPGSSMSPSPVGAIGGSAAMAALGDVSVSTGPIEISVTGGTVILPDGREMVTLAQAREIALATVKAAAPGLVRASVQASGQLQRSAAGRASYGLS